MYQDIPNVHMIRFEHDQIVVWNQPLTPLPRSDKQRENERNLSRGEYNGFMSPKTKSKVRKYLSQWIQAVQRVRTMHNRNQLDKIPYITFVTLTLPAKQKHSDNEIKRKALMPFIQQLQRAYNVMYYFWRAEPQENGNIHFHLIIDSYIDWRDIRREWNLQMEYMGYIDDFEKKHGHRDPNSTDIHKLKNIRRPEAYVIKYCCKTDGYRKIEGRIHGCSDGLRTLEPYHEILEGLKFDITRKLSNDKKVKVVSTDDFTLYRLDVKKWLQDHYPKLYREYVIHLECTARELYTIEIPPEITQYTEKRERKRLVQLELFS